MIPAKAPDYCSFLLRFWRDDRYCPWHATLEDPHTGQKHYFASPEQLWEFLQKQLTEESVAAESQ